MSRSKNFINSPGDTIKRIRENLREGRYSQADGIFVIVKELVQNAEDAKANQLMIAWTSGLPGTDHPLLRGPALLAVNDGQFRAEDGRAIRRFGLNSKAANAASIGKFGLGLKSVFHLAEVFFFIAVDERGHVVDADVLNPWSDEAGGLHPDWDEWSTTDQNQMLSFMRPVGSNGPRFCLWIPLRRKDQLGEIAPITRDVPGELDANALFAEVTPERLARLLPMLRHLQKISVRLASQASPKEQFTIRLDAATRRVDMEELDNLPPNAAQSFGGQVCITDAASHFGVIFSGKEQRRDEPDLNVLQQSEEYWPHDIAMDEATGQDKHVREKARPHAAVCFVASQTASLNARMAIHWSMFLPLSEPEVIPLPQSGWYIDLFLHGYFFVDAGRNQIEGIYAEPLASIQDSAGLRKAWNQRLARRGTLPLLPLALADITAKTSWDENTTATVTREIRAAAVFGRFQSDICRDWCWIRRFGTCQPV